MGKPLKQFSLELENFIVTKEFSNAGIIYDKQYFSTFFRHILPKKNQNSHFNVKFGI